MSLSLSDQEKYVGPTPRRRFAKLSVRNYHSTRHSSTKPNIRIDPVSPLPVLRSMADCDVILQDRDAPLDQEMRQRRFCFRVFTNPRSRDVVQLRRSVGFFVNKDERRARDFQRRDNQRDQLAFGNERVGLVEYRVKRVFRQFFDVSPARGRVRVSSL